MILLERLWAERIGQLQSVEFTFDPRGAQLIAADRAAAQALRSALAGALFGLEITDGTVGPGSMVELAFTAHGRPYAIRRVVADERRVRTVLVQHGASGAVEIADPGRIQRMLGALIGLDRSALQTMIHADPADLPASRGDREALMRQLLGERRVTALQARFAQSDQLAEAETSAAARLKLARAAAEVDSRRAAVGSLHADLNRARVAQAVGALEDSESRAQSAAAARRELETAAQSMQAAVVEAAAQLELIALWRERARQAAKAARADVRRSAAEDKVHALAALEDDLREADQRLAAFDRTLAVHARAETARQAAERARVQRDRQRGRARDLIGARAELHALRSRVERAQAEAVRAGTHVRRVSEEANLPGAQRLWSAWLAHHTEGAGLESAQRQVLDLRQRLDEAARALEQQTAEAARRQSRLRLAGGVTGAGFVVGLIGLVAAPPLAFAGIVAGIFGALAGAWTLYAGAPDDDQTDRQASLVPELDAELSAANRRIDRARQHRVRLAAVERELGALDLEVPTSPERARLLGDSATSRLRRLVDGDEQSRAEDPARALRDAQTVLDQSSAQVRRLEARVDSLEALAPEAGAAANEADLRGSLRESAQAREEANRAQRQLGVPEGAEPLSLARERQIASRDALQTRLAALPNVELGRQFAVRDHNAALQAIRRIEAAIHAHRRRNEIAATAEPAADARERQAALAAIGHLVAQHGVRRAYAQRQPLLTEGRAAAGAEARARSDLATALRAATAPFDGTPTAAEARALFPDLEDAGPEDVDKLRVRLRHTRQAQRQGESDVRRREIETGLAREAVDFELAESALADVVAQRRRRVFAASIVEQALAATVDAATAAGEAHLRRMLGRLTAGAYWDARIRQAGRVELWDEGRADWVAVSEAAPEHQAGVRLGLAVSFIAGLTPRDAQHVPAFLWLDHDGDATGAQAIGALLATLNEPDLADRFPQIVVVARPGAIQSGLFARTSAVTGGQTAGAQAPRASLPAAG